MIDGSQTRPGAAAAGRTPGRVVHWLSFDVEEYFQVEAAARCVKRSQWESIPRRLDGAVDRILSLLAQFDVSATFFVLAWIARHESDLVRRIARAGHEIASHGGEHHMLGRLTPSEFRRDLLDSRKRLEDLASAAVLGYRAPTFSLTHRTAWALDVLAEEGFVYDSSIFPVRHDRYGVPHAPPQVHRAVGPGGGSVLEIPPLTLRLMGANLPAAGGGYLRLFPVRLIAQALRLAEYRGRSGMIYLHPWELDPSQPVLPMGRLGTFRHRVGLKRTESKLRWLMDRFRFCDVRRTLDRLQRTTARTFRYGPAA